MSRLILLALILCKSLSATFTFENYSFAEIKNSEQFINPVRVCFSPQHQCAVLDQVNCTIHLYSINEIDQPKKLSQHKVHTDITDIKITPDGGYLAALNAKNGDILFYPLKSNSIITKPKQILKGKVTGISNPGGMSLSNDQKRLAVSLKNSKSTAVIFPKGSKNLFQENPLIQVKAKQLDGYGIGIPHTLAFSPDGSHLAVVHLCDRENSLQSALVIYRKITYPNQNEIFNLQLIVFLDQRPLDAIAFHPDGHSIVIADTSEGVLLFTRDHWNYTFRHQDTLHLEHECKGVSFNSEGNILAVTTSKPSILFYNLIK